MSIRSAANRQSNFPTVTILLLEARDLNHANALMSRHPGVKMGPFEIRPADESINELIAARGAAFVKVPITSKPQ